MKTRSYNLEDLRDIVVPDPPALWPPAPGVWLVLGLALAGGLALLWFLLARRRRRAYRRAGLSVLGEAQTAREVSVILKRVALAAYPREQVAPLYGEQWTAFLRETCPGCEIADDAFDTRPAVSPQLRAAAASWLRRHRAFPSGSSRGGC